MDIQIASDLHLELNYRELKNIIVPTASILCLVGDICSVGVDDDYDIFVNFLNFYSDKFKLILHVPGNHEYYSSKYLIGIECIQSSIQAINLKFEKIESIFPNYRYLNNKSINVSYLKTTYVFIGTPLWTKIDTEHYDEIVKYMNDYHFIYWADKENGGRPLQVSDTQEMHCASKEFISNTVKKYNNCDDIKIIVLTHHKPFWEENKFSGNITKHAFESDLADELIQPPIDLWCYGHTHETCDQYINGVRIISNPCGYKCEKINYKPDFTVFL